MTDSPEPESMPLFSRRGALRTVSALPGAAAFIGGSRLLHALERADESAKLPGGFTAAQAAFLDEIAETILPATKTPGARAAETGQFMALMVTEAYSPHEREVFLDGMLPVDAAMHQAHGRTFMESTPAQRLELLTALDRAQKRAMDALEASRVGSTDDGEAQRAYFRMMKELALLGFFTSKIGYTQVLRYMETPGRYDSCAPYAPGEPAWALHA